MTVMVGKAEDWDPPPTAFREKVIRSFSHSLLPTDAT